ncbi:hypothetical protein CR513_24542, partial [Mucuna pruriens]
MYKGLKIVEKYHKDIKVVMTRANDMVDLSQCPFMDDLSRRLVSIKTYPNTPSNWTSKEKESPRRDKSPKMGAYYPQAEKKKGSYQIHHLHPKPQVITTNKLQAEQKERLWQDLKKLGGFYEHLVKHSTLRFLMKKRPKDFLSCKVLDPLDGSKYIIYTLNELGEMLDLVGKVLDVVQKDAQSTNDKVEALSRIKEDGSSGGNYSDHSRSSRSSRKERHVRHERNRREERCERRDRREKDRRDELDMRKCKIPLFLGNCKPELYQGSKSLEEYHKEIEMDLLRAQLSESEEAIMARFLHGLNREI